MLVSGYSGIGKSSVVNELHKALVPSRGLFAAGKFDQYKRDIPYATLAQAFQSLVRQLLSKSDDELGRWRRALLEALGRNGQLMVNLIPELALVIGEQPPVPELPPQDAQSRFQLVFRRFLGVFARPEHPLVLFLDDLQWLDAATLDLLERLVIAAGSAAPAADRRLSRQRGRPSHPLMRDARGDARQPGDGCRRSCSRRSALDDVGALVADALHNRAGARAAAGGAGVRQDRRQSVLRDPVHRRAGRRGAARVRPRRAGWTWDMRAHPGQGLHRQRGRSHGGEAEPAARAPRRTHWDSSPASATVRRDRHAGAWFTRWPKERSTRALWEAVRAGLVFRVDGTYAFVHDRVQEAAYALIPESERAAAHLRIGRLLASRTPPDELEEKIFEIVNQLDRGAALIDATGGARAGRRAQSRRRQARQGVDGLCVGAELSRRRSQRCWRRRAGSGATDLTFELELHRAECEFLTGDLAAAEDRLSMLSRRAANAC